MNTYPVYILDIDRVVIVAPPDKQDLTHPEFWERKVAKMVADYHHFPVASILNAPYCQRRGRVALRRFFYCGEPLDDTVMSDVRETLKEPALRLLFDEHHQRLPYDVALLKAAIARGR